MPSIYVSNRYLVMLWYLNDVGSGGETEFPQLELIVKPQDGAIADVPSVLDVSTPGIATDIGGKIHPIGLSAVRSGEARSGRCKHGAGIRRLAASQSGGID